MQDTKFLLSKGAKDILIACGTVSSNCLNEVAALADIPVVGVINAAARAAAAVAKQGKNSVAVLGTNATIESGAYQTALRKMGVESVINRACPMFVPLVENWHPTAEDIATNDFGLYPLSLAFRGYKKIPAQHTAYKLGCLRRRGIKGNINPKGLA